MDYYAEFGPNTQDSSWKEAACHPFWTIKGIFGKVTKVKCVVSAASISLNNTVSSSNG
jgi:hypothetical protein